MILQKSIGYSKKISKKLMNKLHNLLAYMIGQ